MMFYQKFPWVFFCTVLTVVSLHAIFLSASLHAETHPRLLIGPDDVPGLREKVKRPPFQEMLERMKSEAERDSDITSAPADPAKHSHVIAARNAFLYLFTGEDAYAAQARRSMETVLSLPEWANPGIKGLRLYGDAVYASLAYDLCYGAPSWDATFSAHVSKELLRQHEVIFSNGGKEQNSSPASNWQGLRWSSAGLSLLASDEPQDRARLNTCRDRVAAFINENTGPDPLTRGWSIEGVGYTYYPMGNGVVPFAMAVQRLAPDLDLSQLPGYRMILWTVYAGLLTTTAEGGLMRPDFGDDNPHARGEACYGFAFATCPPELLPGLRYWYDRTVGTNGNRSFDNARFGIASSILFYPEDIPAKDPMSIPAWVEAFVDTKGNGMMVYRNRYRDREDIAVQIYAKLRGDKGHNGPDALSFRIAGRDTLWATGGGRYSDWGTLHEGEPAGGKNVYRRSMNTLYPGDPAGDLKINANPGQIVGEPVIRPDGSGHCVLRIKENNVGTSNHTRRFITSFDSGADVACILSDTSENGTFWQLATLGTNRIETSGATFTITSPAGDTLQGTVLHPPEATLKTSMRARGSDAFGVKENACITVESPDGDYLIALTIAAPGKSPPSPSATGTWSNVPDGEVQVGTARFKIQGDAIATQ